MKIAYINIQSLNSKLNKLEIFTHEEAPQLLCLTEHWCLADSTVNTLCLQQYIVASTFCRSLHIHGGTCILVKKSLQYKELVTLPFVSEMDIEVCAISMKIGNNKIAVISLYRPPKGNLDTFLSNLWKLLNKASNSCNYIIICGDFNIDSMTASTKLKQLLDIFQSFNLKCNIGEATRITTNKNLQTSISGVDYMATNIPYEYNREIIKSGIADHLSIILDFNYNSIHKNQIFEHPKIIRSINENNLFQFQYKLSLVKWQHILNKNESTDINFNLFLEEFLYCLNSTCPKLLQRNYCKNLKQKGWINDDIIKESKKLKEMFWLKRHFRSIEFDKEYETKKRNHQKSIDKAKKEFYNKTVSTNNPREVWRFINRNTNSKIKESHNITIELNGKEITEPAIVGNTLCHFFAKNAADSSNAKFNSSRNSCTTSENTENSMFFIPASINDVKKIIEELNNKKSYGVDEVSTTVIKHVSDLIVQPLSFLFNASIEQGCFPAGLKTAKVTPIIKKKNAKHELENFRPISILSNFSKIFERLAYDKIAYYLEKYHLLSNSQHGFRANKSTETATNNLINSIHKELDTNKYVMGLFFDLSKAFDSMLPSFLSSKLLALGIRGNINAWIISYLTDRKMIVNVNRCMSNSSDVPIGAPQGSVISPLLFLCFINDLPEYVKSGKVSMFADDTAIMVTARTPEELQLKVSLAISEFENWCLQNQLIVNSNKTKCVYFHKRKCLSADFLITHNNYTYDLSTKTKFLGTILDQNLQWDNNIDEIASKLNTSYYALSKMKQYLDQNSLINMYYSFVHSRISYNLLSWGLAANWHRIFIIQKRCIRLIFSLDYRDSCKPVFQTQLLLTLPSLFIYKGLLYVKSNMPMFAKNSDYHNHNTRCKTHITAESHTHSHFQKSPSYICSKLFNHLPSCVKELDIKMFKNKIKSFLKHKAYYSIEEYLNEDLKF